MRIAIIGAGVSGNVCAWLLHDRHQIELFESERRAGGHTNTVDVSAFDRQYAVDTGFMVFNDRTYPNFVKLLDRLEISGQPSDMSFSVRCERTGLEYQGSSLNGLFAQRRNILRPRFYRMLRDIVRFNSQASRLRDQLDDRLTLAEFLRDADLDGDFISAYLVPMTAAIWSAPADRVLQMPARFLFEFCHNHGLLQIRNRPQWQTIPGGARSYVQAMLAPIADRLKLGSTVRQVVRSDQEVKVMRDGHPVSTFDAVVFACHADQALALIADPTDKERRTLSQFPYQRNTAVLHTDVTALPRRRAAWASWNYRVSRDRDGPVSVTYDLNRLQRLGAPKPICLTLNNRSLIDEAQILSEIDYRHPVFGPGTLGAQRSHRELSGHRRSYFCGAYWGYGFHEDGVRSALAVCEQFGRTLDGWDERRVAELESAGQSCASSDR